MKPEHNPIFSLVGRILIAALFIPAGVTKLFGYPGLVNYIAAAGLPQPQLAAVKRHLRRLRNPEGDHRCGRVRLREVALAQQAFSDT